MVVSSSPSLHVSVASAEMVLSNEEGDLVVLTAFGAGLTWGANLIRW